MHKLETVSFCKVNIKPDCQGGSKAEERVLEQDLGVSAAN